MPPFKATCGTRTRAWHLSYYIDINRRWLCHSVSFFFFLSFYTKGKIRCETELRRVGLCLPDEDESSRVDSLAFILTFILPDRTAAHKDVCFLNVDEGLICSQPKNDMVVTYSQCCCHYGRGWGPECNTCPPRHSGGQSGNISLLSAPPSEGPKATPLFRYVQPPVSDAPGDRVWWGTGLHGGFCQLQPR